MRILRRLWLVLLCGLLLTSCMGGDALLGKMVLARGVDEHSAPVSETTHFKAGDPVYMAVEFTSAYAGLTGKVAWKQGDTLLHEDTLTVSRDVDSLDPLWVSVKLETAGDWVPGTYQCLVTIPDQGTTTLEFTLEQE